MSLQLAATCFGFLEHLQPELERVFVYVCMYMYIYIYIFFFFSAVKDEISFTLTLKSLN